MSLLVHELLIGTGGGGSGASSLQTSPSNPVPLASVTVTHSNSTVQVAHLQQSRVVTITSSQSRLNTSDKGSRLADALAGNSPYSYCSHASPQQFLRSQPTSRHPVSHILTSSAISSTQADSIKSFKYLPSKQTYVLPFVLQDHNYGAPPPHTPPQSPPPPPPPPPPPSTTPPSVPYNYKVHQVAPSGNSTPKVSSCSPPSAPNKVPNQLAKITSEQSILTINNVGSVQLSTPPPDQGTGSATSSSPPTASQIMAAMPLHRQQFMPHPKTPLYPSPHIPPQPSLCDPIVTQAGSLSMCGGQDTDEESRLSDRSSSVGPSGEETETAPEGEGEEQIQTDDSITRCICNFTHDDGYMIQCDRCFVWQHVDCMEIDRSNIPDEYLCEACKPRLTDKSKARALQIRRKQEIRAHLARVSSSDSEDNISVLSRSKTSSNAKSQDRKVLKKKKPKTSKENKNTRKQSTSGKNAVINQPSNNSRSVQQSTEGGKPSAVKSRRRQSSMSGGINAQGVVEESSSTVFTLEQLRSWIEDYEVAVTNHYSPELRAKVHAARINGISPEFRESTQGALLGHRCRVAPCYDAGPDSFEDKILVAATRLQVGTAIIEYQGKYTLKSQWNCVQIPPSLPYLPFVLQYNMQKEGLSVCVDARTYGNDARFARRSSRHNAEIRHVVERGSVHLYIVSCKEIEEEEEILLPLETTLCLQNPPPIKTNSTRSTTTATITTTTTAAVVHKSDGNENITEEATKLPSNSQIRKNGVLHSKKSVRKPLLTLALPQPLNRTSRRTTSSDNTAHDHVEGTITLPQTTSPVKQRRASGCAINRSPVKCPLKSPNKSPLKTPAEDSSSGESPHQESPGSGEKMDSHKMTREERKIAAYMKAFERMEKAAQRRQEMEKKKVEDKGKRQSHAEGEEEGSADESIKSSHSEKERRKGKKIRSSPQKLGSDFSEDDNNGSSSEGERLKLLDGNLQGYGSPPSGIGTSGFRFPKTKKALMNEWLNETIDPVLHSPSLGEVTTGVPTCYLRSPATPLRRGVSTTNAGGTGVIEMVGRSAKKRWLRQAIIDETEPQPQGTGFTSCSSPNSSRPDSVTGGGDFITPLKKRRLARESMSSEQSNTPPSTPIHSGLEEKYNEELEIGHASDENLDQEADVKKEEEIDCKENVTTKPEIKEEPINGDLESDCKEELSDQLTIDISRISVELKSEQTKTSTPFEAKNATTKTKIKSEPSESIPDSDTKLPIKIEKEENSNETTPCEKPLPDIQKKKKSSKDGRLSCSNKVSVISKPVKKSDKVRRSKGVDKNGNKKKLEPLKPSPKVKRKKLKNGLHTSKKSLKKKTTVSALPTPKVDIPTSNSESNPDPKKDETLLQKDTGSWDLESNVKSPHNIQGDVEKLGGNSGPKTPEGTPPETPVKEDFPPCPLSPPPRPTWDSKTFAHTDSLREDEKDVVQEISCATPLLSEKSSDIQAKSQPPSVDIDSGDVSKPEPNPSISLSSTTPAKPAAVKRKLSILEYRKRKSISCERESKEECSQVSSTPNMCVDAPLDGENSMKIPVSNADVAEALKFPEIVVSHVSSVSLVESSPPTLHFASSPMSSITDTSRGKLESVPPGTKEVKWNAAPTLLEQQRENLTARLRREFGLCLHEDNQSKLKKDKWNDIEARYSSYHGKKPLPPPPPPPPPPVLYPSLSGAGSQFATSSASMTSILGPPKGAVAPVHGSAEFNNCLVNSGASESKTFYDSEAKLSSFHFPGPSCMTSSDKVALSSSATLDTSGSRGKSELLSQASPPLPKKLIKLPSSKYSKDEIAESLREFSASLPGCHVDGKNISS